MRNVWIVPRSQTRVEAGRPDESTRAFFKENLEALEGKSNEADLRRALRKVLDRPRWVVEVRNTVRKMFRFRP